MVTADITRAHISPLRANLHSYKCIYVKGRRRERPEILRRNSSGSGRGRKEKIFEQWHHTNRVEVLSFYSHVLSLSHIPLPQNTPPPALFFSNFTLHQAKKCVTQTPGSRRRGGKLRGEMHKFPGTPPVSPPGHFSFPFTPLFLSLLLLSLVAWFGTNIRLGGILKVLDFRFTGTPFNGFQMCSENPW